MTELAAEIPGQRTDDEVSAVARATVPIPMPAGDDEPTGDFAPAHQGVRETVEGALDRIRNDAELVADRGTTTIADEVVEKIAGIAAREVAGVYDLGGNVARAISAVRERVGLGEAGADADRGVSVRLDGATAAVRIVLVVEYGSVVRAVADQVRANVIGAIERMLGVQVTVVDVVVDDVHV